MASDKDMQALELMKKGVAVDEIRSQLGYRTADTCMKGVKRAIARSRRCKTIETERALELERLSDLYKIVYQMAKTEGDATSIQLCLRIGEQRMRLLAQPDPADETTLGTAFEETVAALDDDARDTAAIAAGRAIAAQMDYAIAHCVGIEVTKALYLMPYLMNILARLGATPKARADIASKLPAASAQTAEAKHEDNLMDEVEKYMSRFG